MKANSHFDVIIVGAGLSGIGAACHLRKNCPKKTFVLLEGRASVGGTWDLFRYPGIRSDSDMYTLGYNFKPWTEGKAIADGPSILKYIKEASQDNDIEGNIRFNTKVTATSWNSDNALWKVETMSQKDGQPTGKTDALTGSMLMLCGGYYNYDQGYTPEFKGIEEFDGQVVHPQKWPTDLDYTDKKVVIIGSGATAMTLVPHMALNGAEEVVMIQRSPTYVIALPDRDKIANFLSRLLPAKLAYRLTRWKNITLQRSFYQKTRDNPEKVKSQLLGAARKELPESYVKEHFTPKYNPWDQRLCLIPNGDLYDAINQQKAKVITGEIECFSKEGLKMSSGEQVRADIVVTATGLNLLPLNGIRFEVDGKAVKPSEMVTYKGMMYSNMPNMIHVFGYINASWTLRADLTAEFMCRLINHMDKKGVRQCTPRMDDAAMENTRGWIEDFSPGYMKRVMNLFPKQGADEPWVNTQNYIRDRKMIRHKPIEDKALEFSNPPTIVSLEKAPAMQKAGNE